MASLYIAEVERIIQTAGGRAPVVAVPPHAEQKITIGGASTASVAFNARTRMVRLHADAICSVAFGATAPTATAANMRLAVGVSEYFGVEPGSFLAVITNS